MDANTRIPLHSGRQIPVLGLGTWMLTEQTAATVEAAIRPENAGHGTIAPAPRFPA
ncbi:MULTISPECIES: hypothetical protein [unclassified Roseitalea]|uniref:hypothetical protein n=1 Tax=unclassified Roseitalea TaxID=2639107 RepID=UPI00273D80E8|nr:MULTISPECIES: hypothetical protein [unclassified Roseitalea]